MLDKAKSPIVIFIILILVALSFAGTGFFLLQRLSILCFYSAWQRLSL